jgi:hypothetical protein
MTGEYGAPPRSAAAVAIATVFLAPLLTVRMPYRVSLVAQAALMLSATLALVVFAVAQKGWRARPAPPRFLVLGVALYAAAAVQGAVVAILRGNDLTLAAGQLLAMGLLPLAAVGAFGCFPALGWRSFAAGVIAGVTAGALLQIALTRWTSLGFPGGARLMLPNALSASGTAPLALLLALALSRSGRPLARALTWASAAVIVVLLLGSKVRSEWLVMPVGIAVYLAVVLGRTRLLTRRVVAGSAIVVLLVGAAIAVTAWWWTRPRTNLAQGTLNSGLAGEAGTAAALLPEAATGAIRVRGVLTCRGTGEVWISANGAGAAPEVASPIRQRLDVAGSAPAGFLLVLPPRAAKGSLSLRLEDPVGLECRSTALMVERIAPALAAALVGRLVESFSRPPDPGAGSEPGAFAADASIAFRVREMSAVLGAVRSGSWLSWIVGHGLGATFALDTIGYDNRGNIVRINRPNYIHNFYLFLPFKLGALGTVEVLAALGLFVLAAVRGARVQPTGSPERRFMAAAAAAWITYIAWSAAAPEILDFRLAPFWGVLVALTAWTLQERNT